MSERVFAAWTDVLRNDHLRPPLANAADKILFQPLDCPAVIVPIPASEDRIGRGLSTGVAKRKPPSAVRGTTASSDNGGVHPLRHCQLGPPSVAARVIGAAHDFNGRQKCFVPRLVGNQFQRYA